MKGGRHYILTWSYSLGNVQKSLIVNLSELVKDSDVKAGQCVLVSPMMLYYTTVPALRSPLESAYVIQWNGDSMEQCATADVDGILVPEFIRLAIQPGPGDTRQICYSDGYIRYVSSSQTQLEFKLTYESGADIVLQPPDDQYFKVVLVLNIIG